VRAIRILLLAGGIGLAMAQDSAPAPAPQSAAAPASAPVDPRGVWLTQPVFGGATGAGTVRYGPQGQMVFEHFPERREFASRPSGVCSVRLLEMPIPNDVRFTMRKIHPPDTGDKPYAEVPAPPCPRESR